MSHIEEDETRDTLLKGGIVLFQSKKGYRHSVDSLILADFIHTEPDHNIVDIGAGNGIIPLLLFKTRSFSHITGIEIQESLARRAERNIFTNNASAKISLICQDISSYRPEMEFDLALSNPPYRKICSGKLNPNREKAVARHELKLDLPCLFESAERIVKSGGHFAIIHKYDRVEDIDRCERESLFSLERERLVCSREDQKPILLLREYCKKGVKPVFSQTPLVIYNSEGNYTEEMEEIFKGRSEISLDKRSGSD